MKHPTNERGSQVAGRGNEAETGRREVRVKRGSWVVALPAFVRARLRLTELGPVYWHRGRPGEAILTVTPKRTAGAPETTGLVTELADAQRLISRLRARDESKFRAMYAEGYALGYQTGVEITMSPHQRRANEVRRRKLWAHYHPDRRATAPAEQPGGAPERVETIAARVLDGAPADHAPASASSPS